MMGGMIWPPVDAMASMPPAWWGLKPIFFIIGMVNAPDATTLATDEPEMEPKSAELIVAILAGPPRHLPVSAVARSMKKVPAPLRSRNAPNIMNGKTKVAKVAVTTPNMASWVENVNSMMRSTGRPEWLSFPGR